MKRVLFAALTVLVAAPLMAWHPPKFGVKENPSPKDGQRSWKEVVAVFKATLPKCGEAMEIDSKGYVCYNDMGVLDLNGTLSADEEVTQIAVWSAMCSPMLTVGDAAKFRALPKKLLASGDYKNVSQDFVARQAYPVYAKNDVYVLLKDCWGLNCSYKVATFVNFSDSPAELSIPLETLEIEGPATVNDLLHGKPAQKDFKGPILIGLLPHQTKQFRIFGKKPVMRSRYTAWDAVTRRLGADLQFRHVYAKLNGDYKLKVTMKNSKPYDLQVNGLVVAKNLKGAQELTVPLFRNDNTLRFIGQDDQVPQVDTLEVSSVK